MVVHSWIVVVELIWWQSFVAKQVELLLKIASNRLFQVVAWVTGCCLWKLEVAHRTKWKWHARLETHV